MVHGSDMQEMQSRSTVNVVGLSHTSSLLKFVNSVGSMHHDGMVHDLGHIPSYIDLDIILETVKVKSCQWIKAT